MLIQSLHRTSCDVYMSSRRKIPDEPFVGRSGPLVRVRHLEDDVDQELDVDGTVDAQADTGAVGEVVGLRIRVEHGSVGRHGIVCGEDHAVSVFHGDVQSVIANTQQRVLAPQRRLRRRHLQVPIIRVVHPIIRALRACATDDDGRGAVDHVERLRVELRERLPGLVAYRLQRRREADIFPVHARLAEIGGQQLDEIGLENHLS
ncbi:hypothetical protein FB451DRAFT_1214039 [Mycena latifolia]|nr:hypothetical protein FB451DRAFT_1214039 [Mycena latifolia]